VPLEECEQDRERSELGADPEPDERLPVPDLIGQVESERAPPASSSATGSLLKLILLLPRSPLPWQIDGSLRCAGAGATQGPERF
jgi:hypothetical protein